MRRGNRMRAATLECGRRLGLTAIPASGAVCGPVRGPQYGPLTRLGSEAVQSEGRAGVVVAVTSIP